LNGNFSLIEAKRRFLKLITNKETNKKPSKTNKILLNQFVIFISNIFIKRRAPMQNKKYL